MRRFYLLPLLLLAVAGFANGQGTFGQQPTAEIERQILKVEAERDHAMQTGDVAVLNRIYADGYFYVNTRGQLHTKAQRLADYRSGVVKYLSFKQDDYRFHIYTNALIMTGRASGAVRYHGVVNRKAREFTNVYIKQGGRWRLLFHQATPI